MGLRPTQGNEKPLAPFSTFVIPSGGDASFASPESRDLHFPRLGQARCLFFDRAQSKGADKPFILDVPSELLSARTCLSDFFSNLL